jgi:TM2 domain-containing membrane protein YozV
MRVKDQLVIGTLLNVVWFGLADLLVGKIGSGLVKMLLNIPVLLFFRSLLPWYVSKPFDTVILILYYVFLALAGYLTVRQVTREGA